MNNEQRPTNQIINVEIPAISAHKYEISVGSQLLPKTGDFARQCLNPNARRVAVVSNRKVFGLYGEVVTNSLRAAGFEVAVFLMPDGERFKNLRVMERVLAFFSENKLNRSDAVIALGGGVVGDLAGFAAAIFQRGLDFLQIPTTLLAQIDSSVGGKTAVNSGFGKNMTGAFHQPRGVLVDVATLQTLARRELIAGFCEAVKHGAIGDVELLKATGEFLREFPTKKFSAHFDRADFNERLQNLIAANIAFKTRIVVGDSREDHARNDAKSRKILNFGHTVGHALEKITDYKRFKHGEAVGLGMKVAGNLSKRLGKINQLELKLFYDVLQSVGKLPNAADIKPESLFAAFSHDKKTTGDSFKWILLDGIGQAVIVDNQDLNASDVRAAIENALQN